MSEKTPRIWSGKIWELDVERLKKLLEEDERSSDMSGRADKIGVSRSALYSYLNGNRAAPNSRVLAGIADYLEVPMGSLMTDRRSQAHPRGDDPRTSAFYPWPRDKRGRLINVTDNVVEPDGKVGVVGGFAPGRPDGRDLLVFTDGKSKYVDAADVKVVKARLEQPQRSQRTQA